MNAETAIGKTGSTNGHKPSGEITGDQILAGWIRDVELIGITCAHGLTGFITDTDITWTGGVLFTGFKTQRGVARPGGVGSKRCIADGHIIIPSGISIQGVSTDSDIAWTGGVGR